MLHFQLELCRSAILLCVQGIIIKIIWFCDSKHSLEYHAVINTQLKHKFIIHYSYKNMQKYQTKKKDVALTYKFKCWKSKIDDLMF